MSTVTAIELGADICALARASVRHGDVHLLAADTLDPAAFPGTDAFATALRRSRRTLGLPRRCRVVVWGLAEGARKNDDDVLPLIAPLSAAGFTVDRVVSPCNALAALARLKTSRRENATCWLAINRGGVAIVVVRPGKQLYSHSFVWDSTIGATGSQARMLQRYSLVAHLAPEVKRAMSAAREQGSSIDAIITCGNLPDLRSLTMPLIEELDVEVETLDSLEGLIVAREISDRLGDEASSIRLACAGATARGTRPMDTSRRWLMRAASWLIAAVALAALLALGYVWYMKDRSGPSKAGAVSSPTWTPGRIGPIHLGPVRGAPRNRAGLPAEVVADEGESA